MRSLHGILKQRAAKLNTPSPLIDCKPAQHENRHGVGHVATYVGCRQLVRHGTRRQGVIAINASGIICHHKGSACTVLLIGQCTSLKPIVKHYFPACKGRQDMASCKRLRWL